MKKKTGYCLAVCMLVLPFTAPVMATMVGDVTLMPN